MLTVATLYQVDLSKPVLEIYWRNLAEYSLPDIQKSVDLHMRDADRGRFLPKPADIIRNMSGDTGSRAIMAWEAIIKALRLGQLDDKFTTGNPGGDRALKAIGINNIKNGKELDQHFLAKRYCEYFEAFDKPFINDILRVDFKSQNKRIAHD